MRDSIVFYRSFLEAASDLSNDDKLAFYDAIFNYSMNDKNPILSKVPKMLFAAIKPQIDANNKKFKDGKKGGRPKSGNKPVVKKK